MRAVLALLVVGLAAAPATANPRRREVSPSRAAPSRDVREAVPPPTQATMREPGRRSSAVKALPSRRASSRTDRPDLWNSLRDKVYDHLPHRGNDRAVSYTLMPMVITGAADSAPAVGLCGSF